MIKDWNRHEIGHNEVFHFKNSLAPFISVVNENGDQMFVNIQTGEVFSFEWVDVLGYYQFYEKEDDPDFLGVEVDGKIEWVE